MFFMRVKEKRAEATRNCTPFNHFLTSPGQNKMGWSQLTVLSFDHLDHVWPRQKKTGFVSLMEFLKRCSQPLNGSIQTQWRAQPEVQKIRSWQTARQGGSPRRLKKTKTCSPNGDSITVCTWRLKAQNTVFVLSISKIFSLENLS